MSTLIGLKINIVAKLYKNEEECMILKCYSSEKLIALNTLQEGVPI